MKTVIILKELGKVIKGIGTAIITVKIIVALTGEKININHESKWMLVQFIHLFIHHKEVSYGNL